jgi:murein DD-endopeptidase MepM/ murein hydrolase activator NlpD
MSASNQFKIQKNRFVFSLKKFQYFAARFFRTGLKNWFKKPVDELTLVLLSKGHLEVQKIKLSAKVVWMSKIGSAFAVVLLIVSFIFAIDFMIELPKRAILTAENQSLRQELNKIQFHLDTLQMSVDRMNRFDQKLRALTDVDKEFAKMKGPGGQGGGAPETDNQIFDFGDYKIDSANLEINRESPRYLERQQTFLVEKLYSWMKRLYRDSELQEQSLEELFEVLKGREIQIASTPSILPVQGWVTSHFGYRIDPFTGRRALHKGLDVAARIGAPVVAPADGVVTFAGPYGSFGNALMIFHGYGISTLYAHTDELDVKVGHKVKRGDIVAKVGNSGRSTASHLHYEVIVHGVHVDPRKFVLDRSL